MNPMDCKDARPLVGAYTDGELSEAQAGPLRQHLMSCQACRNSAQDNQAARRWFRRPASEADEIRELVPAGFAARVARRAFAGDTGEHAPDTLGHLELTPALAAGVPVRRGVTAASESQLGFLIELTGIAAAVLVALTVAFRMREVPSGEPLRADEALSVQEIKDRLGDLNAAEQEAAGPLGESTHQSTPGTPQGE